MSVTSSTFILRYDDKDNTTQYRLIATAVPIATDTVDGSYILFYNSGTSQNNLIALTNTKTNQTITIDITDGKGTTFFDSADELASSLTLKLAPYEYQVNLVNGYLWFLADFPFKWIGSSTSAIKTTGFAPNNTDTVTAKSTATTTNSYTFELPWYPPDTISGQNVFMKLVGGSINGFETNPVMESYCPFLVSFLDFPQPVNTYSDSYVDDCQRSNVVGIISTTNGVTTHGPLILTYIPDGLQRIRIRLDQLTNGTREILTQGAVIALLVQFEVSGTR
jgi:hypothetical protein